MFPADYYFITSSSDNPVTDRSVIDTVEAALMGGARIIQYREKKLPYHMKFPVALQIREITRKYNALFIVNDDISLAVAVDADGVHLGQKDASCSAARAILGYNKIIGISASNDREAQEAILSGADYISMSPVYKTSTKLDGGKPCGLEGIESIRQKIDSGIVQRVPVFAIGGINRSNYGEVIRAGADGVCSINTVLQHNDIASRVQEFLTRINKAKRRI